MKKRLIALLVPLALVLLCAAGGTAAAGEGLPDEAYLTEDALTISFDESVPLGASPGAVGWEPTVAYGTVTYRGGGSCPATIDASNLADGYVRVSCNAGAGARLKVLITGPDKVRYTYNLKNDGTYETFPLSAGSGSYKIGVYKNISGTSYSTLYTKTVRAELKDEFVPFLRPNQYVNYTADCKTVAKAAELTAGVTDELQKVAAIYDYVVHNVSYDMRKAATVQSGYLPDVDTILETRKGICFDYAALMAAMLRSQGVPTKLVVGYAGEVYHAWLTVYTEETGWVEAVVFFDGSTWKRMDPTFASTGRESKRIIDYINDPANYQQKFLY